MLMGIDEGQLLGRHQGLEYWLQQIVQVLPGFMQYTGMLRSSLPVGVPTNLCVFQPEFVRSRSRDDAPCRSANCLGLGLAVVICAKDAHEGWQQLFGTENMVILGSRFCLVLQHLAAEDDMDIDDDVSC